MVGHKQQDYFRQGWIWLLILLVTSWCWTELAIAREGRKYALVAGISDYNNASGLGKLKYARADAEALTQALKRAGYKVQLVVDHGVVKNFLVKTLRQLASFLRPNDTFIFAYSGHGFEGANGQDYLALYGVTSETVNNEGLPVDEVLDLLRKTRASQLLVLLDACRDGMDLQNRTTLVKSATFSQQWFSKNTGGIKVLFATQPGGVSWEDDKLQHGVFTHFLLRGLEGKAKDSTGAITFNSLANYLDQAVSDWGWENNKLQTPYGVSSDNVPLVLVPNTTQVVVEPKVVAPVVTNEQRLPFEPEMVSIPAGSFMMGSPESEAGRDSDEGPQHRVTVKAFQMAKYETTFAEYDAFCEATGRAKPDDGGWGRGNRPVINVTWDDAVAYAKWLSQQTGKDYRLPTEAQWEYAARAGSTSRYFFGDDANRLGDYAWYDGNSNSKTHPVGQKQPNAWGLYDVHGNVWEWTQDRWHDNYNGAPTDGSAWESGNSSRRILRGGSWSSNDGNCRTAYRGNDEHSSSSSYWGFRVACVLG